MISDVLINLRYIPLIKPLPLPPALVKRLLPARIKLSRPEI